jgi:hypothetical protein
VEPDRPQKTIWRMCIACWRIKTTDAHSEYVILIASIETMVARIRLNITLYTHCLSCLCIVAGEVC